MLTNLLCLLTLAVTSSTQPSPTTLPAGWPPLPDFKKPVDYIQWVKDGMKPGLADDAAPFWKELDYREEDAKAKEAHNQLWGVLPNDQSPGLFTGEEMTPDEYRWDPKDHPTWEQCWQMREASRLRQKLLVISRHKYNVPAFSCDGFGATATQPAILGPEDHVLYSCLLPSLAITREGTKVLLQDAWRAPSGAIDTNRMVEAITAAVRIGVQQQQGPFDICWLVAMAQRDLAYESAMRALRPGVLPLDSVRKLRVAFARYDGIELTESSAPAVALAHWLDLYQFAYLPAGEWPPRANPDHLRKIERLLQWSFEMMQRDFEMHQGDRFEPLPSPADIGKYNPQSGAREIADLHLLVRELERRCLPQDAERETEAMLKAFSGDASKHPLARRIAQQNALSLTSPHLLASWGEATRRATHLICAISEEHAARGQWPARLQDLRGVTPECLIDPFSGKSFIYSIVNGEPLLYSVAMDGQDNGGRHDPYRTSRKPGTDYVFWPVQARR